MRLHRLTVTAFGPFVDTAEVDFDALSDAGLFLLSGATGAGKSSVLDAVCFALYGAVPGDRQQAGRLRSDQAPATLAPEVTLELSLGSRRLRIVRSPAWRRPKKRGSGTTPEQARVTVSERADGTWVHLTSRLDEAGDLLSGLLGMSLDQFCQVALLPQGRFQAFLRARPDDRQRLLAQLFRTGRFERVEAWLREHRLALRRGSETRALAVGDLVSRLSEASGSAPPQGLDDLASAPPELLGDWSRALRAAATARRTTAETEAEAAQSALQAASAAWESARGVAAARARVVDAADTAERLELAADTLADASDRLDRARRAEGTRPLARLAAERAAAADEASTRAEASRAAARSAGLAVDDLDAEHARLTDELAALSALLPAEQDLAELRDRVSHTQREAAALLAEQELADAEAEALAARLDAVRDDLARSGEAARLAPGVEADVVRRRAVVAAHDETLGLVAAHAQAAAEHAAARTRVTDLREHLLDLRERRIAGMAAELAGALVVGGDCPVCGSADHPHPAAATASQPDGEAERAAQRAVDDAQAFELALQLKVRDLETSLTRVRELVDGSDPVTARAELAEAEAEAARLRGLAEAHSALEERLDDAVERGSAHEQAATRRRLRLTELATTREHLEARVQALDERVAAARGHHPELRHAVTALTRRRDLARAVGADEAAADAAGAALADATTALTRAVLEAGFDSVDEAAAAQLSSAEVADLERRIHDHRTRLAAAREVLDEPDAWELLTTPEPDLAAAEARALAATDACEAARSAAMTARRTSERLDGLGEWLDAALAEWAPVREALALATRVSSFVEGKAGDNRLQMRLSAYVLAHRLSQVVAAANARLATMSDQRYSLEHVVERGARETRGGLSLLVRDDWSGDSRDPATLSGGETFVVSLALALGLADVVAHEAGGTDLQTLFVDEGFGALDSETLDDVLDVLDALRENGRAVGVVSHVAEMRDRIPTQLLVRKARSGSTLQVTGAAG